ncbi:hypothetical protein CHS0354_038976 [Potamilus streckersoni]|uniref:B box-type domain-containing protein n=1 Tax=Potamilus streckersoni TaxID=2493646 RepID=A0AAE0S0Y2_9BIVA|nr:hypothetical protein CHS0354_038976 [Potamilus streckersoni]
MGLSSAHSLYTQRYSCLRWEFHDHVSADALRSNFGLLKFICARIHTLKCCYKIIGRYVFVWQLRGSRKIINTPRYLPCRHTFCEICLDDLIQTSVASYNKEVSFSCPVRKKKTLSPLPAISIDKWARHFPDDHILLSLLTDDRRHVKSLCSPCRMIGTTVHSTIFCTTFEQALCLNCRKSHESHSLVETSDISSMPNANGCLTFTSPCPVHTSREIEFICMSHDIMCCSDCVIDNHRRYTTLRIEDLSEELIQAKTSTDKIKNMKKLIGHLDCYMATRWL